MERRFEPQPRSDTRAVGAELHPGPDSRSSWCLLVDLDVDAALPQGERTSEPADAGADNDDRISSTRPTLSEVLGVEDDNSQGLGDGHAEDAWIDAA